MQRFFFLSFLLIYNYCSVLGSAEQNMFLILQVLGNPRHSSDSVGSDKKWLVSPENECLVC